MLEKLTIFSMISSICLFSAFPASADMERLFDANLPATASNADRVQLLTYFVDCALPETETLVVTLQGQRKTFSGGLGLAPKWTKRALTETEQRWVSACLLARTNYFGKEVKISMRAAKPAPKTLQTSSAERTNFTLFEGGFHGNLFSDGPTGYVCTPHRTPRHKDAVFRDRICAEPSGRVTPDGDALTRCGFVRKGSCDSEDDAGTPEGPPAETIFIYLEPSDKDDTPR